MAFMVDLESSTQRSQSKSTVDSFASDIEELLPHLSHYALHLTHNAAAADDLVQETVVRGIENIHLWRQGTDLRAWLFTILHNQYVSAVRRALRNGAILERASALPLTCLPRQIAWLELRDLDRALAKLPAEQRSVVVTIGLDGERYETIAARLGVPVGTVRSRLSRGRTRLRKLMDASPLRRAARSRPSGPVGPSSGLIRRDRRSRA
jgi:RNA polymerase sigma-70 factor (ECF subfamily)